MAANEESFFDSDVHLSDVIEVIREVACPKASAMNEVYLANGGTMPYLQILEQPASKALRFRYECEGRSAGSIPGASSTLEKKTYPTVQLVGGFKGRAVIVVSNVTKDPPYRAHPHNLVSKEGSGCKHGICTMEINNESMTATFSNLGIQCVKKKDIEESLKIREGLRVDPFKQGFSHKYQPGSIDLNVVRLCFQAFLQGDAPGKYTVLQPVVSDPIYDKKAMSDLVICKLSDSSAPVNGGKEMILLCEKVAKEDIEIRFYEERNGIIMWEALADFQPSQVHKQVAIWFKTPRYHSVEVKETVHVFVQLRRPSDGATSIGVKFQLIPDHYAPRKRKMLDPAIFYPQSMPAGPSNICTQPRLSQPDLFVGLKPEYQYSRTPSPNLPIPDPSISPFNENQYTSFQSSTTNPFCPNFNMTIKPECRDFSPGSAQPTLLSPCESDLSAIDKDNFVQNENEMSLEQLDSQDLFDPDLSNHFSSQCSLSDTTNLDQLANERYDMQNR